MSGPLRDAAAAPRALLAAIAVAWLLVIARSAVFVIYPQAAFDSDAAIVGLMAKHLAEGRAFPLFFYGQTYLLGVDAWLAAAVFLVTGASVPALHATLAAESLAAVTLAMVALHRGDGLRPAAALVAILPFAFAPPATSTYLMDGAATAAPFVYVGALWLLRRRPLWFGVVLAVGFLQREFVMYAVPALLALEAWDGALWRRERLRQWLVIAVAALATWQVVNALKPFADFTGPGSRGQLLRGYGGSQAGALSDRVDFVAAELPGRALKMLTEHLPRVAGATVVAGPPAPQGREWLRWPFVALVLALAARLVWLRWRRRRDLPPLSASCAAYFVGVGLVAAAAYVATRSLESAVDRYLLLILFIPIGVVAGLLAVEPRRWVRGVAAGLLLVLALGSAVDHVRLASRYVRGEEPDDLPALTDALLRRGIRVAISGYWRAYKVTFASGERVRIASSDFVRIDEYQQLAAAEGDRLFTLSDTPCAGEEVTPGWYLCRGE
jgi:hypothetical protein